MIGAILWQPIINLIRQPDPAALQAEMDRLGVLGPLGFFALCIIQIVGAPIPGHPVQILGGALFGTWLGGLYNVIGMMAGGLIAAWLGRRLGRSFIEKQFGPNTLTKYENLINLETLGVWTIVLFIPVLGDLPYYFAGLSRVKYTTLATAILLSRAPFTFVAAWMGATSLRASPQIFWLILSLVLGILVIGYLAKNRISAWLEQVLLRRLE